MSDMPSSVPLSELQPRHCGLVVEVLGEDDEHERLMAMGVCAGRTVELIQRGDPLILKVYGTRVGVSARLAERVRVAPCTSTQCHLPVLPLSDKGPSAS